MMEQRVRCVYDQCFWEGRFEELVGHVEKKCRGPGCWDCVEKDRRVEELEAKVKGFEKDAKKWKKDRKYA